jgi:primosomal protein N' (replication factor Y)
VPAGCAHCGGELFAVGQGTERVEAALRDLFPEHELVRVDRDTTRRRGELEERLEQIASGRARILVGTKMLSKGHDFPGVTLVAVVDADQGLFGSDFRAAERLAQSFVQVTGRAGRADRPGEAWLQTLFPDHALLGVLLREGYAGFARRELEERRSAGWPPYSYLAVLRAEAPGRAPVHAFLAAARTAAEAQPADGIEILGPAPAPMERRAGRFRGQLLVQASHRPRLHAFLAVWRAAVGELPEGRHARWSLEVDPADLF